MHKNSEFRELKTPSFIIFTDLDATLLDNDTYEWEEALPAINQCKNHSIPLILASSKTRAEISLLRNKMSLSDPFISENGGGIFFQNNFFPEIPEEASFDNGLWRISLGMQYSLLVKKLHEIRDDLGIDIKGFSDMSIEEISERTGLKREDALLASLREYDEPFIINEKEAVNNDELIWAIKERGLSITTGGRFYHLHGRNDKGHAMTQIMSMYKKFRNTAISIALGDSPNDFSMLKNADHPVLIRSEHDFYVLKKQIPSLTITRSTGPKAWNDAVLNILRRFPFYDDK